MMEGLLRAIGEASLSASIMILAVITLRLWFHDRTPRKAFCLLWDIVLVRLLILTALPSPLSIRRWLPGLAPKSVAVYEPPSAVTAVGGVLVQGKIPVEQVGGITYLTEEAVQVLPGTAAHLSVNWSAVLAAVWLTAAVLLAFGFLWNHLRSRKIYAASLPVRSPFVLDWLSARPLYRPVQVRMSDQISAPLTYGVLYPVILLPRGMEDRDVLACVLAHEHTHIRRFDALRKVFLAAALCLHWWNPLVWAMYVLANRDIELACDEAVLQDGADRERYALALLSMEERRGSWSASGSHFSGQALEERIKEIMKRKHISVTALVAVLVVMCITTTVFASAAPEGKVTRQTGNDTPSATGYVYDHLQMVEDTGITMMSKGGEDGEKLYSDDDGKTWMNEERYQTKYGSWGDDWQVEWWTYEDYKLWLEEEKEVLQSIIGERGYNSTNGWFTWDQKMVDETIAMYEGILEEIKNGALYSKTIVDKNGNTIEDVALGSDGVVVASTFETADTSEASTAVFGLGGGTLASDPGYDCAALLEEAKKFGVTGDAEELYYKGNLVRTFVDGVKVDQGYVFQCIYTNLKGTIDIHTLRAVIHNPDGSWNPMGELTGIVAAGEAGFDKDLIACLGVDDFVRQVTGAEGSDDPGDGRTFEEIFAPFARYGLTYARTAGGRGNLFYNGQPVGFFADLKPDGSIFSFSSEDGGDLTIYTQYDENGRLTGLIDGSVPAQPVESGARVLDFAHRDPVAAGRISAGFVGEAGLDPHYGVDIAAERGTDITAFAGGVVTEVGYGLDLGNYVVIDHENGYSTLYGHCGSILSVAKGDRVAMGDKIGEVAATGRATGAVLHFELRAGTAYLDPAQYLDLTV